jgi:hypothetical protein
VSAMLFWGVGLAALAGLPLKSPNGGKISYRPAPVSWHRGRCAFGKGKSFRT